MYFGNELVISKNHKSKTETLLLQRVCSFMKEETVKLQQSLKNLKLCGFIEKLVKKYRVNILVFYECET
jgi:hypothetical protein